jgi:hypothetical protein
MRFVVARHSSARAQVGQSCHLQTRSSINAAISTFKIGWRRLQTSTPTAPTSTAAADWFEYLQYAAPSSLRLGC